MSARRDPHAPAPRARAGSGVSARVALACVLVVGCAAPDVQAPPRVDVQPIRGSTVSFELVHVPEGGFWIGRSEVTWDEFLAYCDFDGRADVPPGVDAVSKPSKPLEVQPYDRDWGAGRRPAVGISRPAAEDYCRWLSLNTGRRFRLPTEAEWELAAGDVPREPLDAYAWTAANSRARTEPVGSLRADARGLHDVLGNLWEWVAAGPGSEAPEQGVLRGGSFRDAPAQVYVGARTTFDPFWVLEDPNVPPGRWWLPGADHVGFRVLREADDHDPTDTHEPTEPAGTEP